MTAAVLTRLPLMAGGALMNVLGRTAMWGVGRYARAPLSNTAIVALAGLSLLAGSNALYFQGHHHPAPMFAPAQTDELQQPPAAVVIPAVRSNPAKVNLPAVAAPATTSASVPADGPEGPIGNPEVFEIQRKLQAFGLFEGSMDGYYGPKTARAIKAFEQRQGLKPLGELSPEIVQLILETPIITPEPSANFISAPEPVAEQPAMVIEMNDARAAAEMVKVNTKPAASTLGGQFARLAPLPTPQPLDAAIETASIGKPAVTQRPLPEDANQLVDVASGVAGDAIDALITAVNGKTQFGPAQQMPAKPEAAAVPAEAMPAAQPGSADPVADIVTASMAPVASTPASNVPVNDYKLVVKVQRALASLGFLRSEADGIPGETTAKAIRNFEVWNNYEVTGRVTPELLSLLVAAGAQI